MLRSTFSTSNGAVDDVTGLSVIIKVEPREGMAPSYLTAMFVPTVSQQQRQRLRSSSTSTLLLPRTQTRYMVIVTSLWLVQQRGTVCLQNFDHRTCQWLCFVDY